MALFRRPFPFQIVTRGWPLHEGVGTILRSAIVESVLPWWCLPVVVPLAAGGALPSSPRLPLRPHTLAYRGREADPKTMADRLNQPVETQPTTSKPPSKNGILLISRSSAPREVSKHTTRAAHRGCKAQALTPYTFTNCDLRIRVPP
ncbi:hypothetical protein HU200_057142 [Digitaria exilis]|uniref:Uncharacterized protein n=1 Tax=Digitaria exilis TaxID=1010633 RepID=A0A835AL59_9POAL|nr:hypothetical protein HU200_057142 [Digitaria exilis]